MITVVKVGGSLYDVPDLGPRLRAGLARLESSAVLLVPGGGPTADVIRRLDQQHRLGEEASHWLALQALSLNAAFLARLFPFPVISQPEHLDGPGILDPFQFVQEDEGRPGSLPHCWEVTSDAVAVRAAAVFHARRLLLLKAVTIPPSLSWEAASREGYVDAYFPTALQSAPGLEVRAVNFKSGEWLSPGTAVPGLSRKW